MKSNLAAAVKRQLIDVYLVQKAGSRILCSPYLRQCGVEKWVPRGGVDLVLAFLSEGPRFEPCPRQLWKKLFQDESSDSHTREWDNNACIIGAWYNSLNRSPPRYLVQWTLVIVNTWIVNNRSLVNIFWCKNWLFYNINYMLNSKH